MTSFLLGLIVGFSVGYPFGLFINFLDRKVKDGRRGK
jgi:hypothetical protein